MGMYDSTYQTCPACPHGHAPHEVEVQFKCYEEHDPYCHIYQVGDKLNPDCDFTGQLGGIFTCCRCEEQGRMVFGRCKVAFDDGVLITVEQMHWDLDDADPSS